MLIYFAGPDVFRPDYAAWEAYVEALCRNHDWQAIVPGNMPANATTAEMRSACFAGVDKCDVVLANLMPFRGAEPDSGTALEVGYALGVGKTVVAYMERPTAVLDRVDELWGPVQRGAGYWCDRDGWMVEDHALALNLMFGGIELVAGGVANAVARLAAMLHAGGAARQY